MNKDINRENSETVRSKYFTTTVMDESLTDFKEPKKLAGPKASIKEKAKKPPKKIRGQKDIRTALKSKKNELQNYAKDFDKVCKHAGLDVDSEQLQLAIALSKSLQESASKLDNSGSSQSQSTKDRIGKIRTTLLEYGFKEIKNHNQEIKKSTNRRLNKKKNYKLLVTSDEAKKQIISEKYSQVLFKDIRVSIEVDSNLGPTHANLYNLATSATYSFLRNKSIFYVEKLFEQSTSTGNLLRDWSEIPGRPVSPELCEFNIMNFSEIKCSQKELDIVLSGSLKSCKNVIKSKSKEVNDSKMIEEKREEYYPRDNLNDSVIVIDDGNPRNNSTLSLHSKEINIDLGPKEDKLKNYDKNVNLEETIVTIEPHRSCSPDLFDELSVVDESNSILCPKNKIQSQENPISIPANNAVMDLTECDLYSTSQKNVTRRCNNFMEMTECVKIQYVDTYLSNKNAAAQSVTQRKSNDFMELTKCVSAPVTLKAFDADIDLTQSPEETNSKGIVNANYTIEEMHKENPFEPMPGIDSTTNKNNIECEFLISEPNNFDLTESPKAIGDNDGDCTNSVVSLDLTQSSNTSDDLPFVSLKGTKITSQPLEETIVMDPKDYENHESIIAYDDKERELDSNHGCNKENHVDTIQHVQHEKNVQHLLYDVVDTPRQDSSNIETSFIEEYYHDHSDNREASNEIPIYNSQSSNIQLNAKQNISDDIDLTQNSESSEEVNPDLQNKANRNNLRDNESCCNVSTEMNAESSQSDIDLTQDSESEELSQNYHKVCGNNIETETDNDTTIKWDIDNDQESEGNIIIIKTSQRLSSLGKRDNVSIDYDEVDEYQAYSSSLHNRSHSKSVTDNISKRDNISIDCDEVYDALACSNSQQNISISKSATDNLSIVSTKNLDTSICSQHSEVFVISDNELEYSMHKSKLEKPVDNFVLGGLSIMDEFSAFSSFRRSTIKTNTENNSAAANINEAPNNVVEVENYNAIENTRTPIKHKRVEELATPPKPSCSGINTFVTPSNSEYMIKTNNVTPMPKYESMSLEDLHIELDKFGVKPFKRKRAIQLLTHIYNQTHPLVESDEETPCKRRKIDSCVSPTTKSPCKITPRKILSPKKTAKSPRKTSGNINTPKKVPCKTGIDKSSAIESNERMNNLGVVSFSNHFEVNETPIIKEIHCNPEDWVFQKREKAKIHSCRVPLHIAFHNYVSSRLVLREAILCYEPVNIDDIHKDLVCYGHRYDPKDLLKFMDKKCITVKTTDNDARNSKR